MTTQAEKNRELALQGFQQFAQGNIDVLRTLLREDFVEHSPDNPSGRDAFIEFIRTGPLATSRLDLKRVIADDTYVVMHYHLTRPDDDGAGQAVVDIWRLEDGLIVEHWDTVQAVPSADRVPQGMF
jgi:predicted SnoaL-like aldol condensation-catalyzing enzyme